MKFLLIQKNLKGSKNEIYRECFGVQRALNYLGYESDVWGLDHDSYSQTPKFNDYDVIINLENYDYTGWVPNLSEYPNPYKILWSVDAHVRGMEIYEETFKSGGYDLLMNSTHDYVTEDYHYWFPNCLDHFLIRKLDYVEKKHMFGFCGSIFNNGHQRDKVVMDLSNIYNAQIDNVVGHEMVEAVNSYMVHFNMNIANDVNFRTFETLGCGTLLITSANYQHEKLGLIDYENCLIYSTPSELVDRLNFCKEEMTKVAEIAERGYNHVKNHTYLKRVSDLIQHITYGQK